MNNLIAQNRVVMNAKRETQANGLRWFSEAKTLAMTRRDSQRAEFETKHPVLSGIVKVTEYVPPSGHGKRVHILKTV